MSILNKVWTTHNENHTTLSLRSNSTDPMKYGYIHITNDVFGDKQVITIPLLSDEDLAAIYFAIEKELGLNI
jgi:hypothetical protein